MLLWGGGSSSEQVSSDGHHMSAGRWHWIRGVPGLMSRWTRAGGGLYSEVQGIMGDDHMGSPPPSWTDRMTHTTELFLRAVITSLVKPANGV